MRIHHNEVRKAADAADADSVRSTHTGTERKTEVDWGAGAHGIVAHEDFARSDGFFAAPEWWSGPSWKGARLLAVCGGELGGEGSHGTVRLLQQRRNGGGGRHGGRVLHRQHRRWVPHWEA